MMQTVLREPPHTRATVRKGNERAALAAILAGAAAVVATPEKVLLAQETARSSNTVSTVTQRREAVESAPPRVRARREQADDYYAWFASRTHVRLLQRQTLESAADGPAGLHTYLPIYQYAWLRAGNLDTAWQQDAIDCELAAWGMVDTWDVSEDRRVTGDMLAANVTGHWKDAQLTLGRQTHTSTAARVARFDGVAGGVRLPVGILFTAYGGRPVIPRFHARREYVLLGSRADSLLRNPGAIDAAGETGLWLAGGGVQFVRSGTVDAGASFHEEHDPTLKRRWLGANLLWEPLEAVGVGGDSALDLDAAHVADARGFVDLSLGDRLAVIAEVAHSSPALLLSRSSVLSVFSLDPFTETGAELTGRIADGVVVSGFAHRQFFSDATQGSRFGGTLRASFGARRTATAQVRYTRATESELGYHGIRASLSYRVAVPVVAGGEVHEYIYDAAVRGVRLSSFGSATVTYGAPDAPWSIMVGGLATRSPFADLDAQGLIRVAYDLDVRTGGVRR